jgi:adenylylsulfate kinase
MIGFCLWMTGLSGAGKSTLARLIHDELKTRRGNIELLDGDVIRTNLSKGLGFSREDRLINLKRIAFVADLLSRNGVAVIVSAITPYQEARLNVRSMVHGYVEAFINCPVETCIKRDPKGLYKKALAGEITRFTGVDDPFEPPVKPEIEVRTDLLSPEESLCQIMQSLTRLEKI